MLNTKIVAVAIALIGSTAAAQSTVDLSINDASNLARSALFSGDPQVALQVANAILEKQPDNRDALLIVAAAAPQLGNPEAGWRAGARAWRLSETSDKKYEAARVTALAAANGEWFTLSTIWLRLALLHTPNDTERDRTLTDARAVQRRNPWTIGLSGSVVPSNNVNSGSEEESETGTFSRDAKALEGVRASLNLSTQYRLNETANSRTVVGLRYQLSRVSLADDGAVNTTNLAGEPTSFVRNANFATDYTELSFGHIQALEAGTVGFNLAVGSFAVGGDPFYDFYRIAANRQFPIAEDLSLRLSAQREIQNYESSGITQTRRTTLGTTLSYRLPGGNQIAGSLGHLSSESPSNNFVFDEWSLRGIYSWAEPIGPISLSVNAGLKVADYPSYTVARNVGNTIRSVTDERQDVTFTYGANIGFPDVEFAGFVPGLAITGSVAESNVARFERNTFSVGFTLSSSF